jgi:hypothetical protein
LFMQFAPLGTHRICTWSYMEKHQDMDIGFNQLKMVARGIYSQCYWPFDFWIAC